MAVRTIKADIRDTDDILLGPPFIDPGCVRLRTCDPSVQITYRASIVLLEFTYRRNSLELAHTESLLKIRCKRVITLSGPLCPLSSYLACSLCQNKCVENDKYFTTSSTGKWTVLMSDGVRKENTLLTFNHYRDHPPLTYERKVQKNQRRAIDSGLGPMID